MHIKKLILLLFLVPVLAQAQKTTGPNYTYIAQRYEWLAGVFKALGIPAGDSAQFQTGQEMRAGAMYYDSVGVDSGLYVWSGLAWNVAGTSYTDADARAAISLTTTGTSGAATYSSATGVFNIPVYAGTLNANAGAFYRWLIPATQEIKTFAPGYGILLDSSSNADAITAILDSATVFPDIRATISGGFGDIGADFVLSNDSLKNNEWVNILDFPGVVGDGTTDCTAGIVSAVSTGKDVFVPEGVFLISGSANTTVINLSRGQKIYGINRFKSILKTSSQIRLLHLEDFCSVTDLGFLGSGSKTSAVTYQAGVFVSTSDTSFSITNCYFKNIGGSNAYVGGAIEVRAIETTYQIGGVINNNIIENCYIGLSLYARAEYLNISNNKFTNTHVAVWNSAGNTALTNNTFQSCDTAHILFGGTNNGHCVSSSNTYNHNTFNLVVDGVSNGHTFNGDMLYAGDIVVRNSAGIKFLGCDFSTGTITLTNNTNLYRSGRWLTMTKSLVSGEDFTVLGETKTGAGAITVFDLLNASDTAKLRGINILSGLAGNGDGVVGVDNNGQLSWSAGGSNTDDSAYHRMSQVNDTTVVFHSNVADDTLVIRGGSAGIGGGGGTIGQPYLITHTSGTTWTTPSDITTATRFKITMVGGGGGGGGNNTANGKGGGGAAGGALVVYVSGLDPSTGYTMAIGAAGVGGDGTPSNGTAGGNTTLTIGATTYTCNGGNPGQAAGGGGTGGTATNGDINIQGQSGGNGPGTASGAVAGTAGGSSGFGLGMGGNPTAAGTGKAATGYGSGGGGSVGVGSTGGAGAQGIIIIEYVK